MADVWRDYVIKMAIVKVRLSEKQAPNCIIMPAAATVVASTVSLLYPACPQYWNRKTGL